MGEQLAQGCYPKAERPRFEPVRFYRGGGREGQMSGLGHCSMPRCANSFDVVMATTLDDDSLHWPVRVTLILAAESTARGRIRVATTTTQELRRRTTQ